MSTTVPDGANDPLDIRLFGTLELRLDGALLPPLRSRNVRWLLAMLILRRGQPLERDFLAGLLWPDSDERLARYSLRRRLTELRHALGAQAQRLVSPSPRTLVLDVEGVFCDVLAFDAAVARGDGASLAEAVGLYRGPLLEGCYEAWVLPERAAREQAYLQALETLAQGALASGAPGEAARMLCRAALTDPLRESAQRGLMQALAADGDYAAAVQVYRKLRLYLHQELHAEPDPETTALFQQIREAARLRAQTPALRSQHPTSNTPRLSPRLPVQFTRFFGREEEIARLQGLLSPSPPVSSSPRLLTLTGPGGSGKTRLAIEAAESLKEALEGAIWFVPLAALTEANLLPRAIVDALGLPRSPNLEPIEQAVGFLNAREGPTLLLLDNCEHLLDDNASRSRSLNPDGKGAALLVRALLERVPSLTCLVTSRQPLNLEGERELAILPLPLPRLERHGRREEQGVVSSLLQNPSVALFVDRAQARRADFQLTEQNAGAVAELCRRLDGLPLAIELAAGWARTHTPQAMLAQLQHRFAFLVSPRSDLPERQLSLQAALEWSYRLLTAELQRFFSGLSVFRGGWTVEAAAAVCAAEASEGVGPVCGRAQAYLSQLVERSLVVAADVQGEAMRFGMLETLQEFGQEKLTPEQRETTRRNHLDFFLALAEEARKHENGPEQGNWFERLETEHDNLRAAIGWCLESEGGTEAGMRLVGALPRFWRVHAHVEEGWTLCARMLARADIPQRKAARAGALSAAGIMAWLRGDIATGRPLVEESLALYRELGDKVGIANALNTLGNMARDQGDLATARVCYEQSLSLCRELDDRRGIAASLHNLGRVAHAKGDMAAARSLIEEAFSLFRTVGDTLGIVFSIRHLRQLGTGNTALARFLLEEGLAHYEEIGDRHLRGELLKYLYGVAIDLGDPDRTTALFEKGVALCEEIEDRNFRGFLLEHLSDLALNMGDLDRAMALYEESFASFQETGNKAGMASVAYNPGHVQMLRGDYAAARASYDRCTALRRETGMEVGAENRSSLAALCQGDGAGVSAYLTEAIRLYLAHGHTADLLDALDVFAGLAVKQGRQERAARLFGAIESQANALNILLRWFHPFERRIIADLRDSLDRGLHADAWQEGRAMTLEQAVAYALEDPAGAKLP
jgi:predicted ATPase/DNA-binding SARP family transcriptional activator